MSIEQWTIDEAATINLVMSAELRRIIEDESALVIEHRFYRSGRSPHRFVCDVADELDHYLRTETKPGDSLYFWRFEECCTDANAVAKGKLPNSEGRIPIGGPY